MTQALTGAFELTPFFVAGFGIRAKELMMKIISLD